MATLYTQFGFQPPSTNDSPNCLEMMLQEGRQESRLTGPQLDYHLIRGDLAMTAVMTTLRGKGRDLPITLSPPLLNAKVKVCVVKPPLMNVNLSECVR